MEQIFESRFAGLTLLQALLKALACGSACVAFKCACKTISVAQLFL